MPGEAIVLGKLEGCLAAKNGEVGNFHSPETHESQVVQLRTGENDQETEQGRQPLSGGSIHISPSLSLLLAWPFPPGCPLNSTP